MDNAWKQHERVVADLIGGRRLPANSGHAIDCESPRFVAQAKLVQRLSLEELTELAERIAQEGTACGKLGLVGVKVRRGAGIKSPVLVAMTADTFRQLIGYTAERKESADGCAEADGGVLFHLRSNLHLGRP